MNNILLFASIVGVFTLMLIVKKILGKEGLIGWMGIASIVANILIIKNVDLLGISSTLGNVLFASNFLATDMLTENYGYKSAKKGLRFAIFALIAYLCITQVALLYTPNAEDIAQPMFETIFGLAPRITLASISLFILSNFIDIRLYEFLRVKSNGKHMWLRNNLCTILCNCSENFLFYLIAFAGIIPLSVMIPICISASVIEMVVALCDTPFLYLSKRVKDLEK